MEETGLENMTENTEKEKVLSKESDCGSIK